MLKIRKLVNLKRANPQGIPIRYACKKKNNCCDICPPSFKCVQPPPEELYDPDENRRRILADWAPKKHHKGNIKPWRNIFIFICVPAMLISFINAFFVEKQKRKRPKFMEFPYLRRINKPWAWDKERTLFHHPKWNALPGGYEVEVGEDEEYDPMDGPYDE